MDGMNSPPSQDTGGMVGGGDMMTMHMTFFWGRNTEILFSGWPGYGHLGMYVLALIVVFFFAVISEWLARSTVLRRRGHCWKTLVYGIRAGFVYLLMLAIMSFNGGVFLVAVAGHLFGFLLFGRHSDDGDAAAETGKRVDAHQSNPGCV